MSENQSIFVCYSMCNVRFLEHFILNGPDPQALDAVLAQLNDPKRQNPQELDKAVIGEVKSLVKCATCIGKSAAYLFAEVQGQNV